MAEGIEESRREEMSVENKIGEVLHVQHLSLV